MRELNDNSVCKESLHTAREGDYKEAYNVLFKEFLIKINNR